MKVQIRTRPMVMVDIIGKQFQVLQEGLCPSVVLKKKSLEYEEEKLEATKENGKRSTGELWTGRYCIRKQILE